MSDRELSMIEVKEILRRGERLRAATT